jgi:hypothetical protein
MFEMSNRYEFGSLVSQVLLDLSRVAGSTCLGQSLWGQRGRRGMIVVKTGKYTVGKYLRPDTCS